MIKRFFVFVFLLTIIQFANAQNTVTISCKFAMEFADSCFIKTDKYFLDLPVITKAKIEESEATLKFEVAQPQIVDFDYNKQSVDIFVEPGDDMSFQIGTDSLSKSIVMQGTGAANNIFYREFMRKFYSSYNKDAIKDMILNTPVDAYEIEIYKQKLAQQEFFDKYEKQNELSQNFKAYMAQTIKYNYLNRLQSFPIIYGNNSKAMIVTPLPDLMIENVTDKLAQNDDALPCESYRQFVYYYVVYQTSKLNNFAKFTDLSTSMERKCAFAFNHLKEKTLNWYVAKFLNDECEKVSPVVVKSVYKKLDERYVASEVNNAIRAKVETRAAAKEDIAANKKPSAAGTAPATGQGNGPKIKDLKGNYFTLDDFKGKVVYIDFWASWCGPCRGQFPYSKELHHKFTKKQLKEVEFLYISIDSKEDAWKKAVEQMQLEQQGKMGIVPGDWGSEICKYFQINSIPRYMIMNKKGEIVDFNAKRPSDEQIFNDLIKILAE